MTTLDLYYPRWQHLRAASAIRFLFADLRAHPTSWGHLLVPPLPRPPNSAHAPTLQECLDWGIPIFHALPDTVLTLLYPEPHRSDTHVSSRSYLRQAQRDKSLTAVRKSSKHAASHLLPPYRAHTQAILYDAVTALVAWPDDAAPMLDMPPSELLPLTYDGFSHIRWPAILLLPAVLALNHKDGTVTQDWIES
jgi:hypothetical protein